MLAEFGEDGVEQDLFSEIQNAVRDPYPVDKDRTEPRG